MSDDSSAFREWWHLVDRWLWFLLSLTCLSFGVVGVIKDLNALSLFYAAFCFWFVVYEVRELWLWCFEFPRLIRILSMGHGNRTPNQTRKLMREAFARIDVPGGVPHRNEDIAAMFDSLDHEITAETVRLWREGFVEPPLIVRASVFSYLCEKLRHRKNLAERGLAR